MKRDNNYDLTQGNILQKLILVALPIMGTQFLQMAYNLTDMFWLGRLSSNAVAASGTAGMYVWLSNAGVMLGRMGSEIGVSQCLGRGDREQALRYSRTSMQIALAIGTLYGVVLLLFNQPLVSFFALQEADVAADACAYLSIVGIGMPFTFLAGAITGSFNGSGNSRTPFVNNAVGLVCNMLLDPFFIFTLDMGIAGAAIATVIAQAVVCFTGLLAIYRSSARPFEKYKLWVRARREDCAQLVRWTIPIVLESMFFTLLTMIITRFTSPFGAGALAVVRVGSQVESMSWLISGGFSTAVTAFCGQNYGAGQWGRIRRGVGISTRVMLVWGTITTLLMIFAGGWLIALFLHEPDLIRMGQEYLWVLSTCQILGCLEAVGSGAFRGIGRTAPPSIISIACNAARVVMAWALSRTALGLYGIWVGVTVGAMIRGGLTFFLYLAASRHNPREDTPRPVIAS